MNKNIASLFCSILLAFASSISCNEDSGDQNYIFTESIDTSANPDDCESACEDAIDCPEECQQMVRGKADIGGAYVHIDVLLSGKTTHRMDLGGVRADLYYRVWKGLVLKPSILYAEGKKEDMLLTGGIGLGFCIPYKQKYCLTPIGGITWGDLRTKQTFSGFLEVAGQKVPYEVRRKQKFRSSSPYIGFEFSYNFTSDWRVVFNYQYAWSRTRSTIEGAGTTKEKSKGSNYAFLVEYDLTRSISINLGGAYNTSLSKEKHGLRAYGAKLGLAYWF